MPEDAELEQCPFCNAKWGECSHVRLLLEWEAEALVREAQAELGCNAVMDDEPNRANIQLPAERLSINTPGSRT